MKYIFYLILFLVMPAWAQVQPPPFSKRPFPGANNHPIQNVGKGIYDHQVMSATSKNGLDWDTSDKVIFDHASVPDAVIDGKGTIFLYFMDASVGHEMSVALSKDLGKSWQKHRVEISDRQTKGHAVDPNPVILEDGRVRLYYLGTFGPPDPQRPFAAEARICSAISADGIHFVEEAGFRFSGQGLTDPDVIKTKSGWKMFVSHGRQNLSTTSEDGLSFVKDAQDASSTGAVSDTIVMDGGFRMYKCSQGGIRSQFTTDFKIWNEEGVSISSRGFGVCDPGIIRIPDGSYKMFYKRVPAVTPPGGNL